MAQSSGGNNANDSSENIKLLPACVNADAMVNVCHSGNKVTMPPTGQTCIKLNFYFFETHAVTQLSITRVKNLCHQEFETAGGYEKNFTLVFVC